MIFKKWPDTRPKMETHEPNVYPTILGGVSRGFWNPFLYPGARSAIFWHLKTGTFVTIFYRFFYCGASLICKHTFNSMELKRSFSNRNELLASSRSHSLPFSEPRVAWEGGGVGVGEGVSFATIGLSTLRSSSN